MQIYLPDDLYQQVKLRKLPASELLQHAVRAEIRLQALRGEANAYLNELIAEVGEPLDSDRAKAEQFVGAIKRAGRRATG